MTLTHLIKEQEKEFGLDKAAHAQHACSFRMLAVCSAKEHEVKVFYRTSIIAILEKQIEDLKEKKKPHSIDMELYEDSSGGSMCEVCGRQGIDLEEDCIWNDGDCFNAFICWVYVYNSGKRFKQSLSG